MPLDVGLEIQRRRAELGAYNRWIVDELAPYVGRSVLDIGCGTGNLLEFFLDRDRVVGIDIGEEFVELAGKRFADRENLRVEVADITDPACVSLVGETFDTIICVNVLEHISNDSLALAHMNQLLDPGGRALLFVPALPLLHGSMDEVDGHYRRYTRRSLRSRMTEAGFTIEQSHYMNFPGMLAWFLDAKVLRRKFVPASHDGLFQRMVPRIAAVERRIRPPVGLSLVVVGRKAA